MCLQAAYKHAADFAGNRPVERGANLTSSSLCGKLSRALARLLKEKYSMAGRSIKRAGRLG